MEALLQNTTALILAGGLGTRLKSVVSDRPKCLADIGGVPFLSHLLNHLQGLQAAVLCTGYRGEDIADTFCDRFGSLPLYYSQEPEPLGTGGALRLAVESFTAPYYLVLNGDSYCDVDLSALLETHISRRAEATMTLISLDERSGAGSVTIDGEGWIRSFAEKGEGGAGWANAGVYVINRWLLHALPPQTTISLECDLFPRWVEHRFASFTASTASFIDIGTPSSYRKAQSFFSRTDRQVHRV